MTAEGPLNVRGDDGDEATSRRDSRGEAKGTPKGLARPRSASAPKGAPGRLRRRKAGPTSGRRDRPRGATICARGEPTPGWTQGAARHLSSDDDARRGRGGRPPLGGRSAGGRGGQVPLAVAQLVGLLRREGRDGDSKGLGAVFRPGDCRLAPPSVLPRRAHGSR